MDNLIMNPQWAPGPGGGPMYFTGTGPITYDTLSINGYRTCSVTKTPQQPAQDFYNVLIDVRNRPAITWGLTIRTVDADGISLVAEFYDATTTFLQGFEMPVRSQITYDFRPVTARFPTPQSAANVRLSIKFTGTVTACTYWAPVAFYS